MVKEYLFFIDYTATDKDDIITDDTIISAVNKEEAVYKLNALLYPEHIVDIDYIGMIKDDDVDL